MTRVDILKERHAQINKRVDELSSIRHISPTEHQQLKELKVLKLRLKDTISSLEQAETVDLTMPDFQPK